MLKYLEIPLKVESLNRHFHISSPFFHRQLAAWDQSDKFVKVYLTGLKGVQDLPKEAVAQEFTRKSVRVRVEGLKGQNPTFFVGELCKEIDPDKSGDFPRNDIDTNNIADQTEILPVKPENFIVRNVFSFGTS